jgi:hypothetical protein
MIWSYLFLNYIDHNDFSALILRKYFVEKNKKYQFLCEMPLEISWNSNFTKKGSRLPPLIARLSEPLVTVISFGFDKNTFLTTSLKGKTH